MAIDFAADLDIAMQGADHPLVALTYAQVQAAGTASKAITKAWRTDSTRSGPVGSFVGLPEDAAEFVVPAAQFTSGFTGGSATSATPGENDTITVSGEVVWEVVSAQLRGAGAWWLLRTLRRRVGGAS